MILCFKVFKPVLTRRAWMMDEESPSLEELEEDARQYLMDRKNAADEVIKAVFSGDAPRKLSGEYHIMLISGNNGRAMIRRYEHGSYETLRENLQKWTDDLKIQDQLGDRACAKAETQCSIDSSGEESECIRAKAV